jgi:hypothetical protein
LKKKWLDEVCNSSIPFMCLIPEYDIRVFFICSSHATDIGPSSACEKQTNVDGKLRRKRAKVDANSAKEVDSTACDESQKPVKKRRKQEHMEREEGQPKFYSDGYWNHATVKCYFNSFCKHKEISEGIRETVKWMSLLSIHTHNVMSIYLNEGRGQIVREEGKTVDNDEMRGVWDKAYRAVLNCLMGLSEEALRQKALNKDRNRTFELQLEYPEGPQGTIIVKIVRAKDITKDQLQQAALR